MAVADYIIPLTWNVIRVFIVGEGRRTRGLYRRLLDFLGPTWEGSNQISQVLTQATAYIGHPA